MDDFDPVEFVMNNHRLTAYRLCAEAYARGLAAGERKGMRKAAEICRGMIADEILTGKVDHNEVAWSEACAQAIEKEANK